jgi:hypothetical protein
MQLRPMQSGGKAFFRSHITGLGRRGVVVSARALYSRESDFESQPINWPSYLLWVFSVAAGGCWVLPCPCFLDSSFIKLTVSVKVWTLKPLVHDLDQYIRGIGYIVINRKVP